MGVAALFPHWLLSAGEVLNSSNPKAAGLGTAFPHTAARSHRGGKSRPYGARHSWKPSVSLGSTLGPLSLFKDLVRLSCLSEPARTGSLRAYVTYVRYISVSPSYISLCGTHMQRWRRQRVPHGLSGFPNYISWSHKKYYIYP